MITLLADSNALRHAGLRAFLQASLNHGVALSDMTLVEMRKTNALATSRSSLEIVAAHPSQVYVLRRTDTMLDENIADASRIADLIDYEATVELAAHARRVTQLPVPLGLAEECAALERDAQIVMARLAEEVARLRVMPHDWSWGAKQTSSGQSWCPAEPGCENVLETRAGALRP